MEQTTPGKVAINTGVQSLSNEQVLAVYHAVQTGDSSGLSQDFKDALEARADVVLGNNDIVGFDSNGHEIFANTYYEELNNVSKTKEYQEAVIAAGRQVDEVSRREQENIDWNRENYAKAVAEYNENAEIVKKNLGLDLDFEAGTHYSETATEQIDEYNTLLKKYNTEDGKGSTLDAETLAALSRMKEIADELEVHSTVGNDTLLQQTGARDENSVDTYFGSGTGGTANDQQGIGESNIGTGIGAGGSGNGNGNGVGDGDGNGGQVATSVKGGYNSNGTPIATTPVSQTDNSNDAEAIASYLSMINDDVPINHIFHNSFYQNDPVAHWSFTIDFIPSVQLQNNNINLYECGQRLTKAVIAASVPDRNVKSTVSHYKGMTIELPARAKTAGTLQMRFAETETFPISTILNQLYQFARSDTYFERIDNVISTLQNEEQIARYTQLLRAYRQAIPDGGHLYNILVKMYKMKDVQAFSEDNEVQPSFVYFFVGCDLQTVNQIDFNYDDDKPIDVSCVWVYQYFEELTFDEYKQRYGAGAQPVSTDYNPNGTVDSMLESMEGNPNAHKEAVEYSWNEDIKRDNLSMMANDNWEQLVELEAMEDLE